MKLKLGNRGLDCVSQPPSGGCVLKPTGTEKSESISGPAAFRRLCVETPEVYAVEYNQAPSRLQAAVC